MSVTSKSPLGVAREALAIGSATLRDFAHRFSPKTYTQPQLFACLVLKTFLKTDYRGICRVLKEWAELRQVLGLGKVPHYTTLQKASQRLLSASRVRRLLTTTIKRRYKRKRRIRHAALDSTGLACGHASLYYTRRRWGDGKTPVFYRRYAKLELATDCATHLILAALAGRGPRVDVDRFVPLLDQTLSRILLDSALADAGYDSEANHRYARETCGVRSFIPALHGRPTQKPPSGRYRRQMKQRLDKDYGRYGQRWQVETVCSMIKRRLSTYVAARSHWGRCRELMLLIVTHNTMILLWVCRFSTEQLPPLLPHPSGVCDANMNKTRFSLRYLGSYLVLIGLGLLFAPEATLRLRQSKEEYGNVFLRVAGMLMSGLAFSVFGIIGPGVAELYPATIFIRIYFLICLAVFYRMTSDPLFMVLIVIVGIGSVLTLSFHFLVRRKKADRSQQ